MHREKSIRILIADDYAPWRTRARAILQASTEWQVSREACDGLEAVQVAKQLLPDIVVLDIGMPVLNGIEAAKRIRQDSPASKIIFATQSDDVDIRTEALAMGAEGYLLKANAASELVPAISPAEKEKIPLKAALFGREE